MSLEERLTAWIESNMGGTVRSCVIQDRWRDSWFVELERDGSVLALYAWGDRNEEFPPNPLEYEAAVIAVLGRHGIPVPEIYGVCPDPHAIIMEQAPGRTSLENAYDEAERVSVLEHLGGIIAAMHQLDTADFVAAGMRLPTTPAEMALPYFQDCERHFRARKSSPDPRVEFLIRWAYRNVPDPPERLSVLHADPGQFLFDDGRVTVMLDFELAAIGDPMMDIAGLRQRSLAEPMGDIRPLLRRYVELTGVKLDAKRISYHSGQWLAASTILMAEAVRHPRPNAGYNDYLSWYVGCMQSALQAIAEFEGFDLADITVDPPPVTGSRWSPAFAVLADKFRPQGPVQGFDRVSGASLARFVETVDRLGDWSEAEYIRDVADVVGRVPADWQEADALLEAHVLAEKGDDRRLVEIFYRWLMRQHLLISGTYQMPYGKMMPIDELLDLSGP